MAEDREPFLSRWSRQKLEAKAAEPVSPPEPAVADGDVATPAASAEVDALIASLPKLEDLTAESSIAAFFQKGVPVALQQAAMRRMWTLDPQIRDFVEVAENQWDWNTPGGCPGCAPLDGTPEHAEIVKTTLRLFEASDPGPATGAESGPEAAPDTPARPHAAAADVAQATAASAEAPALPLESAPARPAAGSARKPRHGGALPE